MTDQKFKDHFSNHSFDYKKFRPVYPEKLYHRLAKISPGNECAWDCATGNGQAAIGLSKYFKQVIATDASSNQLAHA
ncbi:MAG TPA: class I SAM-dependent methyltransferase, partial [Gammaproteobacteria bacterium]